MEKRQNKKSGNRVLNSPSMRWQNIKGLLPNTRRGILLMREPIFENCRASNILFESNLFFYED